MPGPGAIEDQRQRIERLVHRHLEYAKLVLIVDRRDGRGEGFELGVVKMGIAKYQDTARDQQRLDLGAEGSGEQRRGIGLDLAADAGRQFDR